MSLRLNYSVLLREFQFFAGDNTSAEWSTTSQNYAVSAYGNKIAITDINQNKLYIVAAVQQSGGAALIDNIKKLATSPTGATEALIKNAIGINPAYFETIDLSKDQLYLKALALNPELNATAGNFASWLTALSDAGQALATTPTPSPETLTPLLFAGNARTHLFSENMGTTNDDLIFLTNYDVANAKAGKTVSANGGADGRDSISIADSTQERMSKETKGLFANISNKSFTDPATKMTIAANTATFTAKSTALADATGVNVKVSATLTNIDSLNGTEFDDYLVGNSETNFFDPGAGSDVVIGNSDPATYHGGNLAYKDRVSYWGDAGKGINATASATTNSLGQAIPMITVTDTSGGTDKLYNISYVVGSVYADTYNGATWDNKTNPFKTEFVGLSGADIVNGNGTTRISYLNDPAGVTVNLSGAAIKSDSGVTVAANTALDGFGSVDVLKQIFGVRGSDFSDLINLGSGNEVGLGHAGDDKVLGNGGNDNLWGGGGNDVLVGGSGVDLLVGRGFTWESTATAGDKDVFKFNTIGDASGTAIKTQAGAGVGDIVLDFEIGSDLLDLSAIDANARIRGDQKFKVDATNVGTFQKTAGQIIYKDATLTMKSDQHIFYSDFSKASSSTASGTQTGVLIQGDIQGDGKADFSIFLIGVDSASFNSSSIIL